MGVRKFLLGFTNRARLGGHGLPRFQGWSPLLAIAFHTLLVALPLTNGFVLQFNAVSPVIWSVGGDGGGGYRIIG